MILMPRSLTCVATEERIGDDGLDSKGGCVVA